MQAVILAGGLGAKLRPLTHVTAKLMLKVYNKPFLEHHVAALRNYGICDIVILVGHLGGQIKSFFGNGKDFGVSITYSEDNMLGSGGAIKNACGILDKSFIVINGDTYLPEDYNEIVGRFSAGNSMAMMTICDGVKAEINPDKIASTPKVWITRKNNVAVAGNEITEYNNKQSKAGFTHVDCGVTAMRKPAIDLTEKRVFSLEDEIYPELAAKRQLSCFITKNRFFDIRELQRLENVRKIMESN